MEQETIKNGSFEMFKEFYQSEVFGRVWKSMDTAFLTDEYKETITTYLANIKQNKCKTWLLIQGGIGTGKTTTAKALCKTFNKAIFWDSVFGTGTPYIGAYMYTSRAIIEKKMAGEERNMLYQSYALAAIDDVGAPKSNIKVFGTECNPIADILAERYERNLPIILTTNLTDAELLQEIGALAFDRLREKGMRLLLNGESYRNR